MWSLQPVIQWTDCRPSCSVHAAVAIQVSRQKEQESWPWLLNRHKTQVSVEKKLLSLTSRTLKLGEAPEYWFVDWTCALWWGFYSELTAVSNVNICQYASFNIDGTGCPHSVGRVRQGEGRRASILMVRIVPQCGESEAGGGEGGLNIDGKDCPTVWGGGGQGEGRRASILMVRIVPVWEEWGRVGRAYVIILLWLFTIFFFCRRCPQTHWVWSASADHLDVGCWLSHSTEWIVDCIGDDNFKSRRWGEYGWIPEWIAWQPALTLLCSFSCPSSQAARQADYSEIDGHHSSRKRQPSDMLQCHDGSWNFYTYWWGNWGV